MKATPFKLNDSHYCSFYFPQVFAPEILCYCSAPFSSCVYNHSLAANHSTFCLGVSALNPIIASLCEVNAFTFDCRGQAREGDASIIVNSIDSESVK